MAAPPTETTSSSATPTLVPQGKHAGKPSLPIGRAFTMIGSRSRAHLHLLSSTVSKAHAAIINDAGNLYVRDTASREHVIVNGQPVREANLLHGDQVKIGSFAFRFVDMTGKSGRAVPDPAPQAALEMDGEALPILFEGRTILIGRRPTCDVLLKEASVSNVHAIIFELNHQHYIRDLGSRTGTFVNGEQIHNQPLKFDDVIRVGDSEMRFVPTGVASNLDELEHLIGTSKLGAETIALASIDAARYTAAATDTALPAAQSVPAAPPAPVAPPQRFTSAPAAQAPQHFTATPVAPQAPQRFTAAPATPTPQHFTAAPAVPQAPQRFTAAPAAQAPQYFTAAPSAPQTPQRYTAAPAAQAPRQFTAPPAAQAPQRYTAAPAAPPSQRLTPAPASSTADLDKVDLDADLDVSGSGATKAIPLEGLGDTSRTPVLSSQVVDTADEIDLEEIPASQAPAAPHVADAPPTEEAELELAFAAHDLESAADENPAGEPDDLTLEWAPQVDASGVAGDAELTAAEHVLPDPIPDPATSAEAENELIFAADDHILQATSNQPVVEAEMSEHELGVVADDDISSAETPESAAAVAEDESAVAADDHISRSETHAPADLAMEAERELALAADDHISHGVSVMPAAEAPEHELAITAHDSILDDVLPIGVEPIEHAGLEVLTGDAPSPAYADEEAARVLNLPLGAPVPPAFGVANSPGDMSGAVGAAPSDDALPFPLIAVTRSTSSAISASVAAEVIAPTDPSPESAQQLASQLDQPGSGIGQTLKVDELSDSTFGRAVQDFTGSALGSLIENHPPAPLPQGSTGDPIVDDALAFLAHENGTDDVDFGLDFDNPVADQSVAPAPAPQVIDNAESPASIDEQIDDKPLGVDFDILFPEEATDTAAPQHSITAAESLGSSADDQGDADMLGLDLDNLSPEVTTESTAPQHAITTAESIGSSADDQRDAEALGLDFNNLTPEETTETAAPRHAISADESIGSGADEQRDTEAPGLDFDNLSPEEAAETAAPRHAIATAEYNGSSADEQRDAEALGLDFNNLTPEETTETAAPQRAITADEFTGSSADDQRDAEALGLDFDNLAPDESTESASPGYAITTSDGMIEPMLADHAPITAAPEPALPTDEFIEAGNAVSTVEEPSAGEAAVDANLAPIAHDDVELLEDSIAPPIVAKVESPAEAVELPSIEELEVETRAPGETQLPDDELPEDLFDWDFEDLSLQLAREAETEAALAPSIEVEEFAAQERRPVASETTEPAPIDDAEAAKMLLEPADPAPFDLDATMAEGLEGFDELQTDEAPHDSATISPPGAGEETAFTVADLDVSPAERAELFETKAPPAAPITTNVPPTASHVTLTAQEAMAASEQFAAPPAHEPPPPVARPAPPIDPFFGMSRDFGSFMGGVPLGVPTQSMSPPLAPPPPPRPAPPQMFGDTPVSLAMKQDVRSPAPHVSRAALTEVAASAPAPLARAPLAPPAAPVAPAPVSSPVPAEFLTPHSPLPTPDSAAAEPWDEELPELADLAPDLFREDTDAPVADVETIEPAPETSLDRHDWLAAPQPPDEALDSQFEAQVPSLPTPIAIEKLDVQAIDPAPAASRAPEIPPAPAAQPKPPAVRPATLKPSSAIKQQTGSTPITASGTAPLATARSSAPAATIAKGLTGPIKGGALKSKTPGVPASSSPANKPPARAPLKPRKPALGLTAMGMKNPALPSVDVFSQLPVDPDGGASIPLITARAGFVPPGSESSRRPPGVGFRPPAPRKPGDPPPAARGGRAAPLPARAAARIPVIAEGLEDVAEPLPLPSEELLQHETPELPPEQTAEPEKKKKKWKFPFLKIVLLGLTAGGAAGAWFGLPPEADLTAAMKFDGIADFDARQHAEFAHAQARGIDTAEFRKAAQAIYESDFHGRGDGFLSGNTEADAMAYPAVVDSVRSRGDQLLMRRDATLDPQGDANRFRAILKALYRADLATAQNASAQLASRETAKAQLNQMAQRMEQLQKQLQEDQRKKAEFELAQLKEKDLSDRSAMLEKVSSEATDAVDKLKAQVQALAAAAAVPPSPIDDDPEIKRLTGRLAESKAVLAAAQPTPNGTPPNAAETLDVSLHQLKQEVDAMDAVQASAKLAPYFGVVRKVESDLIQANADRAERQRIAQQTLADLKRSLAEKKSAYLESIWKMDGRLVQIEQDLAVERHRLGAAAAAGLTGDANRIRGRINELTQSIQSRRDQIADAAPDTAEIKSLQKAFADQIDRMRADASQHDQRIAAQYKLLDEAAPPQTAVAPEQQPLLDRLTTKVAAVNTARQLLAYSTPSGTPDISVLTAQVSTAQSQLDARRKQVADDAEKSKQANADALAKSQASLDAAEQTHVKAVSDAATAKKELADMQASLAAIQSAPADLARDNAESVTLASQIDKLKEDLGRQPAIAVLTPLNPQAEDLVQIMPLRNYRNAIVAACGGLSAILLVWIFAGMKRSPEAASRGQHSNPSLDVRVPNFPHRPAAA